MLDPQYTLRIEYCTPCDYQAETLAVVEEVLGGWAPIIKKIEVVPRAWGMFEVALNDELIFSVWTGERHPEPGEITAILRDRLGPEMPGFVRSA
jgi:selT/selW/selH-like putative selenoprotein